MQKYTEDFCSVVNVTNAARSVKEITLTVDGDVTEDTYANIKGIYAKIKITAVTAGSASNQWVLTTEYDHNQTYSEDEEDASVEKTVKFVGDFSGTKDLIEVNADDQFTIESETEPTGTFYLLEQRDFSGRKAVTIDNENNTIKYDVEYAIDPYSDSGTVMTNIRIDGISSESDIIDLIENNAYALTKNTIFVVMGSVLASADRHISSDSINRKQFGEDLKTECKQDISLYIVIPTQTKTTPRTAINSIYTLRSYILKSLNGAEFDSGLTEGAKFCCTFIGDVGESYNKAFYVHRFDFEIVFNITDEDSVPIESSTAFRSFEIGVKLSFDDYEEVKKQINGSINEDEDFS